MSQIHDGVRVTSASSYLARAANRSNLHILVNTRVTKLLPVGNSSTPDMRTVQFAQTADGLFCHYTECALLTIQQVPSTTSLRRRR